MTRDKNTRDQIRRAKIWHEIPRDLQERANATDSTVFMFSIGTRDCAIILLTPYLDRLPRMALRREACALTTADWKREALIDERP